MASGSLVDRILKDEGREFSRYSTAQEFERAVRAYIRRFGISEAEASFERIVAKAEAGDPSL